MANRSRTVRLATPKDAADCLEIYQPIVEGTPISFETNVPSEAEFARRISALLETHPWIVCELSGDVAGYAYGCVHRTRTAYQWSVEVSAYVDSRYHRRGVGRILYEKLFECLANMGFKNVFAGITLPNDASVVFHESMGFVPIGVFERIGYKFGAWHDVGWWSLRLSDTEPTRPPAKLCDVREEIDNLLSND